MHIAAFDLSTLGANGIVGAGMGIAIAEAIRSVCYRDDSAPAAAAEQFARRRKLMAIAAF